MPWLRQDDEGATKLKPLGITMGDKDSSVSVLEVEVQAEAPGVTLPSRGRDASGSTAEGASTSRVEIYGRA